AEAHQCEDDNAEHDEQDQVTMRKRLAVCDGQRNGERGRQRDDAAYSRIAYYEYLLPWRLGVAPAQRRAQPPRYVGGGAYPDEAGHEDDRRREQDPNDEVAQ